MTKINKDSLRDHLLFRRPANRRELRTWIALNTGLVLPGKPVCPNHQSPLDYLASTFFEEGPTGDAVVWACRGGGKTMIGALATLLDLVFKPGIQVRILGGSLAQSDRMYAYLKTFFEGPLAGMLRRPPTRRRLELTNGSAAEVLAQSSRSVRGTRVQKLRCDEIELFDPEVWNAAQLATRWSRQAEGPHVRGAVEALSTMHKPGGIMQQLLDPYGPGLLSPPAAEAAPPAVTADIMKDAASAAGSAPAPGAAPAAPKRRTYAWCIWDVIAKCHPDRNCVGCPLWNDCRGRAKEADGFVAVDDVIAMQGRVSRAVWEHEMLCYPPRFADAVFESFRRKTHVIRWPFDRAALAGEKIRVGARTFTAETLIAGVDFGMAHAFVALWIALFRDERGRRVAWVVDELVIQNKTLPVCANAMKHRPIHIDTRDEAQRLPRQAADVIVEDEAWQPAIVYCDVAGGATNSHSGMTDLAVMREAGFKVQSSRMGIEEGVLMLMMLLDPADDESPRLLFDPRCIKLLEAMEGYRRERNSNKPRKDGVHDHPIDALRYALVNHDHKAVELTTRKY